VCVRYGRVCVRNVESVSSPQQNLRPLQPKVPNRARRSTRCIITIITNTVLVKDGECLGSI